MAVTMYKVRQLFNGKSIADIPARIEQEFAKANLQEAVRPGSKIAVAAGSRGIANISEIIKAAVVELKKFGAKPFIVPAMGSHGGATAEGQTKVLNSLGITEESMGVPIHSSMEVIQVGTNDKGVPVYLDKNAAEADGIFIVNRVKAHTDFDAPIESGLVKMIAIGLGKHKGCVALHTHGLAANIPKAAGVVLKQGFCLGGLAILENSKEETAYLEVVKAQDFLIREKELLKKAKKFMAKLPFKALDVLVVKTMGKAISGTGMDTNVLGRLRVEGVPEPDDIKIKRVVVLTLADNSYGNALGVGLADLTTKRLVDSINFDAMYANVISTSFLERGKIPIYLPTDREAINTAIKTAGPVTEENVRLCVTKNTLELEELIISERLLSELKSLPHIEVLGKIGDIPYSAKGELQLF